MNTSAAERASKHPVKACNRNVVTKFQQMLSGGAQYPQGLSLCRNWERRRGKELKLMMEGIPYGMLARLG
jgi:hypothetical protein